MSGNDILTRVRKAVHIADSLEQGDRALAQQLLQATERCHQANTEFLRLLELLHPSTPAGEAARTELQQQLTERDCGDKLLRIMLEPGTSPQQAEIHLQIPRSQLQ